MAAKDLVFPETTYHYLSAMCSGFTISALVRRRDSVVNSSLAGRKEIFIPNVCAQSVAYPSRKAVSLTIQSVAPRAFFEYLTLIIEWFVVKGSDFVIVVSSST
jgi:hypothetical protein